MINWCNNVLLPGNTCHVTYKRRPPSILIIKITAHHQSLDSRLHNIKHAYKILFYKHTILNISVSIFKKRYLSPGVNQLHSFSWLCHTAQQLWMGSQQTNQDLRYSYHGKLKSTFMSSFVRNFEYSSSYLKQRLCYPGCFLTRGNLPNKEEKLRKVIRK